jgi:hypothetical protein
LAYVTDDVFVDGGGDFGVYGEFSPFSPSISANLQDSNSLPTPTTEMKVTLPGSPMERGLGT